ncbi:hypothetical protein HRG_012170 [Hirsutella rhossiliensis]
MLRRKAIKDSSKTRGRKQIPTAEPPTIGQVVDVLSTYSPDDSFDTLKRDDKNHELLRRIYFRLQDLFKTSKTRSEANRDRIKAIQKCELDREIADRFPIWNRNPLEFWENSIEALPKYGQFPKPRKERLRIFYEGALQLKTQFKVQVIMWRFITVSAYRHFRRKYPGKIISKPKVRKFLTYLGLLVSGDSVQRFANLLLSGQRRKRFCQELQAAGQKAGNDTAYGGQEGGNSSVAGGRGDNPSNTNMGNAKSSAEVDYGPLFLHSIPDNMHSWDAANGLVAQESESSMEYLLSIGITEWSEDSGCRAAGNRLIGFHEVLIWAEDQEQSSDDEDTSSYDVHRWEGVANPKIVNGNATKFQVMLLLHAPPRSKTCLNRFQAESHLVQRIWKPLLRSHTISHLSPPMLPSPGNPLV